VRFPTASFLSAAAALALAAPALAERPGWFSTPSISGQPRVGATILGSPGGIKCDPGCVGLVHEWTSCAGPGPAGADRPTGGLPFDGRPAPGCAVRTRGDLNYAVRAEDAGRYIQLHVIATNYDCGSLRNDGSQECGFSSGHGYSATIGPIAGSGAADAPTPGAVAPANTGPPSISGVLRVGEALTVSNGSWSGTEPLRFSYQWIRCAAVLGGCQPIPGATAARYDVAARDVGVRLTVIVSASNRAGSMWAAAAQTETIAPAAASPRNVLDVRDVAPGHRLVIAGVAAPRAVRRAATIVVRVRVTDRRRVRIRGATVQITGRPGDVSRVTRKTGATGEAVLRVRVRASARPGTLVLTVRAVKFPRDRAAAVRRVAIAVRR
jgi:hypothetical protein